MSGTLELRLSEKIFFFTLRKVKGKALKAEARTLGFKYMDHKGKAESAAHAESRTSFEWQWNQLFIPRNNGICGEGETLIS